jgi:hypothetical protein
MRRSSSELGAPNETCRPDSPSGRRSLGVATTTMQTDTTRTQTDCGAEQPTDTPHERRDWRGDATDISGAQYYSLEGRRQAALALPPHGETWTTADVDPLDSGAVKSFHVGGVIARVERQYDGANVWETEPGIHEWVHEHFHSDATCPGTDTRSCPATGIRCLEAGECYTCTDPNCEARFGPTTARRLLNGQAPDNDGDGDRTDTEATR